VSDEPIIAPIIAKTCESAFIFTENQNKVLIQCQR
jgi:hypothetical protein